MQHLDTVEQVKMYISYIYQHKKAVVLAWQQLKPTLIDAGLLTEQELAKTELLILKHDDSKYDEKEFNGYRQYYYPHPQETENASLLEQSWQTHIAKNPHHFENLREYQGEDYKCYIIEMVCDWIAMEPVYNQSAYDYYAANQEIMNLPQHQAEFLDTVINLNRPKVRKIK